MTERPGQRPGVTLLEVVLVLGILVALAALAVPNLIAEIEGQRLPTSAEQMRSLITMTRANAMFDGKRYLIRFPREDELDDEGDDRQPLIEREDDPVGEPWVFNPVKAPWVYGETLLRDVWCAQVRLGKPTVERLQDGFQSEQESERLDEVFEDEEPDFPPLIIEPDGTSEWATFVITNVSGELTVEDLEEDDPVIDVILDGVTGLIWLQRPFKEEELDMLEEHNWPPVLRQDFLRPQLLTEEEVLEIREKMIRINTGAQSSEQG
ncbi:MAG: pilus assembly FimT family protein [Planctomycetota bacterium]